MYFKIFKYENIKIPIHNSSNHFIFKKSLRNRNIPWRSIFEIFLSIAWEYFKKVLLFPLLPYIYQRDEVHLLLWGSTLHSSLPA